MAFRYDVLDVNDFNADVELEDVDDKEEPRKKLIALTKELRDVYYTTTLFLLFRKNFSLNH